MAAQKESESKELEAKLHQERMDSTFQRDMLQYLIQDATGVEIDSSLLQDREGMTSHFLIVERFLESLLLNYYSILNFLGSHILCLSLLLCMI